MEKEGLDRDTDTVVVSRILVVPRRDSRSKSPGEREHRHGEFRKDSGVSMSSSIIRGTTLLCFRMSDVAVSMLVLLPLTIAFWRGIWQIMDYYSSEHSLDPWLSMGLGNGIPLFLYCFQEPLKRHINPRKLNFILFYIITRFLLILHSFGSVNQWRGLWVYLDMETGFGYESASVSLLIGVLVSIPLKVFCNILAIPLFVGVDEATSIHDCPLRYKSLPASKWKYILDCAWSVLVVQTLVVLAWRGLWNLANLYLYPDDMMISSIVSVGLGNGLVIALCILQPCYYKFMTKLKGFSRLAVFDAVTLCGFVGCVLAWRGTWELYNLLIVFETKLRSEWITTIIGAVGAAALGSISTVVVRGVTVDGEDSGDGTIEWPISYISLLQKRHHNVPFPEPWLFRYLCTSQNMTARDASKYDDRKERTRKDVGEGSPLRVIKNLTSVHSNDLMKVNNLRLNDLKNIDSSSEEDLGVGTRIMFEAESPGQRKAGTEDVNFN